MLAGEYPNMPLTSADLKGKPFFHKEAPVLVLKLSKQGSGPPGHQTATEKDVPRKRQLITLASEEFRKQS